MTRPDLQIDPEPVHRTADKLIALADEVRSTVAAAEVNTAWPDAPAGFGTTMAAMELWAGWSRQLDQTATDAAVFGHDVHSAAATWQQVDAASAAALAGG